MGPVSPGLWPGPKDSRPQERKDKMQTLIWGPVRVGAHMGPYGPLWVHIWAHMGPYMSPCGPFWVLLDRSWDSVNFPSTFRKTIWTNFARFGSKNCILMEFLNDSGSFLLEKLKNHFILTKNHNIWPKIPKIPQQSRKFPEILMNS